MTKILSREDFHILYAYFKFASDSQKEVRKNTKEIARLLGEGKEEAMLNDAVYDPLQGSTRKDYEELLDKAGITIEWRPAQNEFAKEQRREEKKSE